MEKFFYPDTVAVIGASNSPFNLGATISRGLRETLKFEGDVYVVNMKGEDVGNSPGFTSVLDIPGDVDLGVIIVAARHVPQVVRDCGEKGIRHIIIESAGFSEESEDGKLMQDEIDKTAEEFGIRILGPNCLGVISAENRFCCFYGIGADAGMAEGMKIPGELSYIIQSGGVGALVLESLKDEVVKLNKMVSIGNKSDVDEADLIEYFNKEGKTKVIGMYLESVTDGRKLMDAALSSGVPVMAFKVGKTEEGTAAAMSHTAGMANNNIIFESACRQSGIIRLKTINELHSMPKMLTAMPLLKGNNIAVFTNSGAFGGITADLLIEAGLKMPELSSKTQERLGKTGQIYNKSNPVDLGPAITTQMYVDIFEILLSADEVDGLLPVPNIWQGFIVDALEELVRLCEKYNKPAAIYTPNSTAKIISIRNERQIPLFETAEEAVRALEISFYYHRSLKKKENLNGSIIKQSSCQKAESTLGI